MAAFGTVFTPEMIISRFSNDSWTEPQFVATDSISLHPGAHVLHYSSTCFEGLKAFKHADGSVHIFRMDKNVARLAQSSELTLRFRATTPHNPSFWQIYLSKPGFNIASEPLSWNQLELIHQQSDVSADAGYYTLQVPLPTDRSGAAVLYTRWQRVDVVGEGFYNCSDIELVNGNTDTPPPLWFDKGAYVNLQTPAEVGGYAQLRLFDADGQELIDQSWQITANNIANALWATELAAQVNTQYSNLLQIGLLNGDNVVFSSDLAANRAYVRDNSHFYNLDLRPAPDDGGDDGGDAGPDRPGQYLWQYCRRFLHCPLAQQVRAGADVCLARRADPVADAHAAPGQALGG